MFLQCMLYTVVLVSDLYAGMGLLYHFLIKLHFQRETPLHSEPSSDLFIADEFKNNVLLEIVQK